MTWSFKLTDNTNLLVTATSRTNTNLVVNTNVTVAGAPNAIEFYATNMASGDNRQPYFNNLQISQGDGTPPVVSLSANQRLIAIPVGGSYTADAGATATDDVSGNVTSSITNNAATILTSTVLNTPGTYTVTYSATDAVGNVGTATQTVVVHPVGTFASLYNSIAAPGTYAFTAGWSPDGTNNTALVKVANFQWALARPMTTPGNFFLKFAANGNWDVQWGVSSTAGTAQAGGDVIPFSVPTTGIYTLAFNESTLAYSLARATTNGLTYAQWAAQYGLAAGSGSADADNDLLSNNDEYTANTDPTNDDTDGDGLTDGDEVSGITSGNYFFDENFNSVPIATSPLLADTDGDGLADRWEILNTLDPTDDGTTVSYRNFTGLTVSANPNGSDSDPDGDGISNALELAANSNPLATGTGFATISTSIHLTGAFTTPEWTANPGTRGLNLVPVGNFAWRGIFYWAGTNSPADKSFKFVSDNTWDKQWGTNATTAAGFAVRKDKQGLGVTSDPGNLVAAGINAKGYYVFELNESSGAFTVAPLVLTDADGDEIPDAWEAFYGAQLATPTTNLVATADSNGNGVNNLDEYKNGGNPVLDVTAPVLSFASGVEKVTWVAKDGTITLSNANITATDDITPSPTLSFNPNTVNTANDGLTTVTYTATDAAGNASTLTRLIVVGDAEPTWRKIHFPKDATITTVGSATVYGRIFVSGFTDGPGQVPNITAELGVNNANTDPATWPVGAWKTADYNPGFSGGDDEYSATISGADLTAGTYYYAFRFKIGSGAWRYAGINAAGTDGGPWDATNGSGVLTVNQAQIRNVTFALDMRVQQFKNAFASGEKVVVSGDFNGWGTNNELTLDGGSGLHQATLSIEGAAGATNNYKFRILGPTRTNDGLQYETTADRPLVLGAANAATNLSTAFFNNLEESRKITFRVDMSTQIAKGNFNGSSNTVSVAGSFNGWTAVPLSAQGSGVYATEIIVDGPLAGVEYKFLIGTNYEANLSNRTLPGALPSLQASTLDSVLFNNDDGIGPVITRTGDATINLAVGESYTDDGATAIDAIDGSVTVTTTGTVNPLVAGTYTITYNASDAAGNAATPVTRTVIVSAASGSTFAGWLGSSPASAELVKQYAFGAATPGSAVNPSNLPAGGVSGSNLTLTYYVRAEATNPNLVVPQVHTNLTESNSWSAVASSNITTLGTNTVDGVQVIQKQASVPVDGARKFLRLKIAE